VNEEEEEEEEEDGGLGGRRKLEEGSLRLGDSVVALGSGCLVVQRLRFGERRKKVKRRWGSILRILLQEEEEEVSRSPSSTGERTNR